ncbi:MAG: hypothetical protein ACI4VI_09785 [Acutalibacteraceae bacterium]
MREFLKLDVIMQRLSKLMKKGNKAKKVIKAFTISWTLFNIIAVIWSLIPKTDKLDEVDAEQLILACSNDEASPEELIAEKEAVLSSLTAEAAVQ